MLQALYKCDPRNPEPIRVTVQDFRGHNIQLVWEPMDVVMNDNGYWSGINEKYINYLMHEWGGRMTWPKRLQDIMFSDPNTRMEYNPESYAYLLECLRDRQLVDSLVTEGKLSLRSNELISIFPIRIVDAKPGLRMTAKFLHEVY